MPHIVVEYSNCQFQENGSLKAFLDGIIEATDRISAIDLEKLKLRAYECSNFLVAGDVQPFTHINVSLMAGPSGDQLIEISDVLHAVAIQFCPSVSQVTLDVRLTNPKTYRKRSLLRE